MRYGELPANLGIFDIKVNEIMTYQYLPVKLAGQHNPTIEPRLKVFNQIIGVACCNFVGTCGLNNYVDSYMYITAKHRFVSQECPMNRCGYHSDSYMTDDINYIWSDCFPTIFNTSYFNLTQDDKISLTEMEQQAKLENEINFAECSLLRLTQYSIHKVAPVREAKMRTFFKLSFSKDKFNLIGNSHNHLLDYEWEMKERSAHRNITSK
jgi:hypothetical protein